MDQTKTAGAALDAAWRGHELAQPEQPQEKRERNTRQAIYDTVVRLYEEKRGAAVSRKEVAEALGTTIKAVDDHLNGLKADASLFQHTPGYYVPVELLPEPRAISVTMLPDGAVKIEIGDQVIHVIAQEYRMLQVTLGGAAGQFAAQLAVEQLAAQVAREHQHLIEVRRMAQQQARELHRVAQRQPKAPRKRPAQAELALEG